MKKIKSPYSDDFKNILKYPSPELRKKIMDETGAKGYILILSDSALPCGEKMCGGHNQKICSENISKESGVDVMQEFIDREDNRIQ